MINILPKEEKDLLYHEYWMRFFSVIFIMISILGLFATLLILPSYFFSNSKEAMAEKSLEDFNRENPEIKIDELNQITADINAKLKILDNTWPNGIYFHEIFESTLKLMPKGITVNQFIYNKKSEKNITFEIHGIASDRPVLQNLKTILENNGNFTNVNLPISNFVKSSKIDFSISFSLK